MSQPKSALLRLEGFAGGLNDTDPLHRIADNQLSVATDVELTPSGGIKRRSGVSKAWDSPASASFQLLVRHTPSNSLADTEVWAMPNAATNFYRSTTGTTWGAVSVTDTGASQAHCVTDAVSFNGKLYIAYRKNAGTNRLHVWDGTALRMVGLSTPAAATVADTGAGAYAAVTRYYKVQFHLTSGSGYTFSDLSPAVAFTPAGTGTHARITKPATPTGALNWRIWGSADNISYYLLADQVVATTTYDDNAAPSSYATTNQGANYLPAESGAYTAPWSAKYLLVDDNRLLIAGAFETAKYASRIGWSSIIGTAAAAYGESVTVHDDERFPSITSEPHYLDLDTDEGGPITGMEMLGGSVYVFKRWAIYKLVRTGDLANPYRPVPISKVVGALSRRSIVPGEDELGGPCLYFLNDRGPYRLGAQGLQYLGGDIETVWATVNTRTPNVAPHGVYHARDGKVRWWVPRTTSSSLGGYPDTQLIFHVRLGRSEGGQVRGGWTMTALDSKNQFVASSAMLPFQPTVRDSELAPHTIHVDGAFSYPSVIWLVTSGAASDDIVNASSVVTGTTSFTPTVTTKAFSLGVGDKGGVTDVYLVAQPSVGGTTFSATLSRDFGAETRTQTQAFTGTATRQAAQVPDLTMAQAQHVSLTVSSATQASWVLDEVALRVKREEPV